MATLDKIVDKTSVKFTDTFTYTIYAAFSGIEGDINNAVITEFIPNYIQYTLPKVVEPIKSIDIETQDEGDLVKFNFGTITDTGISVEINLSASFKIGTDNLTTFLNEAKLYINDELDPSVTAQSEEVVLEVNEDFYIEKEIAVPGGLCAPGGRVIYTIMLRNKLESQGGNGDLGAKIKDIIITDLLPTQLSVDPQYPVYGSDKSVGGYVDKRYDGQIGVVSGNNITFSLPEYYGNRYRIVLVCNIAEDVEIDSEIVNTAALSIQGQERGENSATLTIGEPTYGATSDKYVPKHSRLFGDISYDLKVENTANQDLDNFIIEDTVPDEVTITSINTGSFKIDVINELIPRDYKISYEVNNSGSLVELPETYNMAVAKNVVLPDVGEGNKITRIRWTLPKLAVGATTSKAMTMNGIVTSTNEQNEMENVSKIVWIEDGTEVERETSKNTSIDDKSVLNVSKSVVGNKEIVFPEDTIRYSIRINGTESAIDDPVIIDILSDKVNYVGNEVYTYFDYFEDKIIDSDTYPDFFDEVPMTKEIISNYNSTEQTLVRYNFDGFRLRQRGFLTIEYDVEIKNTSIGSLSNKSFIGNKGENGLVGSNQIEYIDLEDLDIDGISDESIVVSKETNLMIATVSSLASGKKVKGALDDVYTEEPLVGKTYEAGKIDYELIVKNTGNVNFNYIEIVDIFPYIGDTGVLLNDKPRKSEFPVYSISDIEASIMEDGNIIENIGLTTQYSNSHDPVRFAQTNLGDDVIGTDDDWTNTISEDLSEIKAIKIIVENKIIKTNQYIKINIHCIAPYGVEKNKVAWNSFAIKARYIDENGEERKLVPVEPEKVGVEVLSADKASIGGFVWLDSNENGYHEAEEVGMNNVEIQLLSQNDEIIQTTKTSNDMDGNPGFYLFSVDIGDYYIKVIQPVEKYYTRYNDQTQSKIDTNTGKSLLISITDKTQEILDIDCGFVETLNFILRFIEILENDIYGKDGCEKYKENIDKAIEDLMKLSQDIVEYLEEELKSGSNQDMGYLAQLNRYILIIKHILNKIKYIVIPDNYCNVEVVAHILLLLTEYILNMIEILGYHDGIYSYNNICGCMGIKVYEMLIGKFINGITMLEYLHPKFNELVMILNSTNNLKTYIPMYSKKENIVIPYGKPTINICCNPKNNCRK